MNGDDRSLKLGASNEKLVLFVIRIVCLGLGYWSFVLITDAVLKAARAKNLRFDCWPMCHSGQARSWAEVGCKSDHPLQGNVGADVPIGFSEKCHFRTLR